MTQKRQYLIPNFNVLELNKEDVLLVSGGGNRDPFDVDGFDPLGSGVLGG